MPFAGGRRLTPRILLATATAIDAGFLDPESIRSWAHEQLGERHEASALSGLLWHAAWRAIAEHEARGRALPEASADLHLGFLWLRHERGDLGLHELLLAAGREADRRGASVDPSVFHLLTNEIDGGGPTRTDARPLFVRARERFAPFAALAHRYLHVLPGADPPEPAPILRRRHESLAGEHACRVCGLEQAEPIRGADGDTPTFAVCPRCDAIFGSDDATEESIAAHRERWLAAGGVPSTVPRFRARVLRGLPAAGAIVAFGDGPHRQEGLAVELHPENEAPWVAHFSGGHGALDDVQRSPWDPSCVVVVAHGRGYVVRPQTRELLSTFGGALDGVAVIDERVVFTAGGSLVVVSADAARDIALDPAGSVHRLEPFGASSVLVTIIYEENEFALYEPRTFEVDLAEA